ncbi:uncharacterized protein [Prorops nasuta]|uniref:uncharacterized protein n=1 Tax=Prorops nasuta TaxID=863751 RepID=UPI0034CF372E
MEAGEFILRQKNSNTDRCVVKNCGSRADKNLNLRFHCFPKPNTRIINKQNIFGNSEKIDICKAWKINLKINNISKRTKVCSLHFKKSDYFFADVQANKRFLKRNAVPSCNLPETEKEKTRRKVDEARLQRRIRRSKASETLNTVEVGQFEQVEDFVEEQVSCEETNMHQEHNQYETINETAQEKDICIESEILNDIQNNINKAENLEPHGTSQFLPEMLNKVASVEPLVKHIGVQVNTDCFVLTITNCINRDSELSTATGIESFKLLDTIVEIVRKLSQDKFEHYNVIMNTRDRVIMTFMKLKQNLSYSFLAICFSCYSAKHCQRIFHDIIKILSKCFKAAIQWPSKEEILRNLPQCFEGFENVRVVLDCTEIIIQHPAKLCCQVLTYSHYKSENTCKVMTGVSPAGNITYLSKVYGGRVTNSTIFQQSNLIQLLEAGDGVMVDRGFLIDEICEKNEWKCIRPPFLKEKKQFTKEESVLTAKIARARVHIERSNQRIKAFKILGSVLPSTLVPLVEDIFTVVCGTINMSAPILNDNKFINVQ